MKRTIYFLPFLAALATSAHATDPLAGVLMFSGTAGGLYNFIPDVAYDKAGDVLAGGVNMASRTENFDIAITKFSGTSAYQDYWTQPYDFASSDDEVRRIFTDSGNNVVVVGPSVGLGTDYDWVVLKYTDAGKALWTVRFNGPSSGRDVPVGGGSDSNGYLYFGGLTDGGFAPKMTVMKLSPTGHQVWVKSVTFPNTKFPSVDDFTVSANGDSYLLSDGRDAQGNFGYFVQRYNANGVLQYSKFVKASFGFVTGNSICADASGNAYIAGIQAEVGKSANIVAKFSPSGAVLWSQIISVNGYDMFSSQVATDPSGNVFTYVSESSSSLEVRLAKYDKNGAPMWNHTYQPGSPSYGGQLAVDSKGGIYVSTSFKNGSYYVPRVAKYDTTGNIVWEVDGFAGTEATLSSLKVDPNFDVYVSGGENGTIGGFLGFVEKVTQTPVVANDVYSTTMGVTISQPAPGVMHNDLYTKGAKAILSQAATHGSATLNADGSFTYVPDGGFKGTDKFTYTLQKTLQNGSLTSPVGIVTVHVN